MKMLESLLMKNGLLTAFAVVGLAMLLAQGLSRLSRGRLHGSAIAIALGLIGAALAGGNNGLADLPLLSGLGLMGGSMLRDLAIVATAQGVRLQEFARSGWIGALSLALGLVISFVSGVLVALAFGYRDAVSLTTLGAGAATYIVGPVTGAALGASSEIMALSIATGLVKAIAVMMATPFLAPFIGLNNPRAAMIFGGLMGTNSGVMAGLAATDPKLVPYGAMTATFYTGLGCLLGPSLFFMIIRSLCPT
jgi:malonate transporter MadM subunit